MRPFLPAPSSPTCGAASRIASFRALVVLFGVPFEKICGPDNHAFQKRGLIGKNP